MILVEVKLLPRMSEERLKQLSRGIVSVVTALEDGEVVCMFPRDMMDYELGKEIIIDAIFTKPVANQLLKRLAIALMDIIRGAFPQAEIGCLIGTLNHRQFFSYTKDIL